MDGVISTIDFDTNIFVLFFSFKLYNTVSGTKDIRCKDCRWGSEMRTDKAIVSIRATSAALIVRLEYLGGEITKYQNKECFKISYLQSNTARNVLLNEYQTK